MKGEISLKKHLKKHNRKKENSLRDEAILRDITRKLHPEELRVFSRFLRKRLRRRPERLKLKSLRVEAETARGLKPILVSNSDSAKFVVHGHNPERVTLGSIGNLDFYCYPNLWDDRVFIGLYPNSVQIEEVDFPRLFSCVMRTYHAIRSRMTTKRIEQISLNKKLIRHRKTAKKQIRGKFKARKSVKD